MFFEQPDVEIRCEWGVHGIAALQPTTDVFIIVDVLSFSTCVDIAVSRGAVVFPYQRRDESAIAYAEAQAAVLASRERTPSAGYSLAPTSLLSIPAGTRLVLPSPNGSTLSLATGSAPTLAGCLRNAAAVAQAARSYGPRISVIAAGERWPDGSLRPAVEDWIGAGAIIAQLVGTRSPEAALAEHAFLAARSELMAYLQRCGSGRELIGRGFAADVALAGAYNESSSAPILSNAAYTQSSADAPPAMCGSS